MKKILFALTMLALVLPALPQARADVSIDFFYNNLSGGNGIEVLFSQADPHNGQCRHDRGCGYGAPHARRIRRD